MASKSSVKATIRRASKSRTAWIVGIAATAAAVGAAVYFGEKSAAASPGAAPGTLPVGGPTITVPISAPSGSTTGNLGVVAVPYGATLILTAPSGATIASVNPSASGMVTPLSTGTTTYTMQMTAAFNSSPSALSLTIVWTDQNNIGNTSMLQVVPQSSSVVLGLTPGTMPNLTLPATGGQMLFAPPAASGSTQPSVQSGSVSGTGLTGQAYAASSGYPGGSYGVIAAGAGVAVVTVNWTDGTGTAQSSTINVVTTAS